MHARGHCNKALRVANKQHLYTSTMHRCDVQASAPCNKQSRHVGQCNQLRQLWRAYAGGRHGGAVGHIACSEMASRASKFNDGVLAFATACGQA